MNSEISLLAIKDVIGITSLSKSTIYRKMNDGEFPRSLDLGGNCRRWLLKDVQKWISALSKGEAQA
jgi:prophage regulatory protein